VKTKSELITRPSGNQSSWNAPAKHGQKLAGPPKDLITDPDDPKFDIDAVIAVYVKE